MEKTRIFRQSELRQKKYLETKSIFRPAKLHRKSTWKRREFFDQRNHIKKVRGNDAEICQILVFNVSL